MLLCFADPATPEIYTLSLHDALPISEVGVRIHVVADPAGAAREALVFELGAHVEEGLPLDGAQADGDAEILLPLRLEDRKSTRLNSSHVEISYAVFCLKKKTSR